MITCEIVQTSTHTLRSTTSQLMTNDGHEKKKDEGEDVQSWNACMMVTSDVDCEEFEDNSAMGTTLP